MPLRGQGRWIHLAAPLADQYVGLTPGEKREFLRQWSSSLGESENTLWRAMAGFRYLEGCGLDPLHLQPPPALIAVEAVQRTGKYDREAEHELIEDLRRGYVVRHFLARYKSAKAAALERQATETRAKDVHAPGAPRRRTFARPLRLSDVLARVARGRCGPYRLIATTRHLLEPSYALDIGAGLRAAIIVAAYDGKLDPYVFQLLIDRLVLRCLLQFDEVHVCTEVDLPELQDSRSGMDARIAQRLTVLDARMILDLKVDGMSEEFEFVDDLLRAHAREDSPGEN